MMRGSSTVHPTRAVGVTFGVTPASSAHRPFVIIGQHIKGAKFTLYQRIVSPPTAPTAQSIVLAFDISLHFLSASSCSSIRQQNLRNSGHCIRRWRPDTVMRCKASMELESRGVGVLQGAVKFKTKSPNIYRTSTAATPNSKAALVVSGSPSPPFSSLPHLNHTHHNHANNHFSTPCVSETSCFP